jgi:hypothetical protein
MSGINWQRLAEDPIFRPNRIQAIIDEMPPNNDILKATSAFMPRKDIDDITVMTTIMSGPFGMTSPLGDLGSQHNYISGPRLVQYEHSVAHWREAVKLDEKTLLRLQYALLAGNRNLLEEHITKVLRMLDIRVDNRIEHSTLSTILTGSYTVNEFGVNYTYTPVNLKPYLTVDVTASPPWTSAGAWSALNTADPLTDVREFRNYLSKYGLSVTRIWMTLKVAGYLEDNAKIRDFIKNTPSAPQFISVNNIFQLVEGFKGLEPVVDDRRFVDEYRIFQAVSSGATQVFFDNIDRIKVGDDMILENATGQSERVVVSAINASLRRITFSSALQFSYSVGDFAKVYRRFFDDDTRVIFECSFPDGSDTANWVSVPSLASATDINNPKPGKTPWRTFVTDRNPKYIELGNGISGGPVIHRQAWGILKIA